MAFTNPNRNSDKNIFRRTNHFLIARSQSLFIVITSIEKMKVESYNDISSCVNSQVHDNDKICHHP
jgi:hypothetical protein